MYMTYINIKEDLEITYDNNNKYKVAKGYYSMENFIEIFKKVGCKLEVKKHTGKIKITGAKEKDVVIPNKILYLLGLTSADSDEKLTLSKNVSKENVTLPQLTPLNLYVYLDELDREYNLYNGSPSNLLCVLPLKNPMFGDIINIEPRSSFKRLTVLDVNRFKITIKDGDGN